MGLDAGRGRVLALRMRVCASVFVGEGEVGASAAFGGVHGGVGGAAQGVDIVGVVG
jgi:hypothetical protein